MALVFSVQNCCLGVEVRLQADEALLDLFELGVLDVDLLDLVWCLATSENCVDLFSAMLTHLLLVHRPLLVQLFLFSSSPLDVILFLEITFVANLASLIDQSILLDAPGVKLTSLVQAQVPHELLLGRVARAIYVAEVFSVKLWECHGQIQAIRSLVAGLMPFVNILVAGLTLDGTGMGDGVHQITTC